MYDRHIYTIMLHRATASSKSKSKSFRPSKNRSVETARASVRIDRYFRSVVADLKYLLVTSPYDSEKKFPFGISESQGNENVITGLELPNIEDTDDHPMCCIFTGEVVNYEFVRDREPRYMMGDAGPAILYRYFEKHNGIYNDDNGEFSELVKVANLNHFDDLLESQDYQEITDTLKRKGIKVI